MPRRDPSPLRNLAILSQLGLSMMVPIIGGVLLGNYLDEKFSKGNIFLILFTIIGALAAFRNLFVIGMKSAKNKGDKKDGGEK